MKQPANLQNIITHIKSTSGSIRPYFIAIDGRSGTGKSTISQKIADALGDTIVIDQDDFYVGGDYKTWQKWSIPERAERTIEWKRLRQEVLEPLANKEDVSWHAYDWDRDMQSVNIISAHPAKYVILEGTYSTRQELKDLFNTSILVEVEEKERKRRIQKREGDDFSQEWDEVWSSAEDYYFKRLLNKENITFVIDNTF